ncbi:hypothetical protein LX32DRAFT_719483 [Colletotrichum zoysiae]|uniref:Cytochrome P450 n=1 Tax=Colletotrichum zoysiae TaxID=1216348 RepID=A0AAD9M4T8_9PEZI|nr:hypothetical protein LX32DRAFT_719483 [Colletotrichum zoysiae]
MILALLSPVVLFILCLVLRFQSRRAPVRDMIRRNRDIANFSIFGANSLQDRLQLRAGPNARLVTAFGIHNSFTTTDEAQHREFLRRAVHAIKSADADAWSRVWGQANEAMDALGSPSFTPGGLRRVSVERTARVLCFGAVLELLFAEERVRPFDADHADRATKLINLLWQESKKGSRELGSTHQEKALDSLRDALRQLVRGEEGEALALIMPAYETLWRVVLLTYVHVAFRYIDAATKESVREVVEIVSGDAGEGAQLHPTVDRFALEALRLYPPTKRIYRASTAGEEAADVESLHHDERIWGPDALEFRPGRFAALTQDQKNAYMPFGADKNVCPAVNGFGGKMIASLVVVLIKRLGTSGDGARIWFGDTKLDTDTRAPLPTGRNDMWEWVIRP